MEWVKGSKTQWFANMGTYWLHIRYMSGFYWVSRIEKDAGEIVVTEATIFTKLSAAKEYAKELVK
jgi:hypothetical protein